MIPPTRPAAVPGSQVSGGEPVPQRFPRFRRKSGVRVRHPKGDNARRGTAQASPLQLNHRPKRHSDGSFVDTL